MFDLPSVSEILRVAHVSAAVLAVVPLLVAKVTAVLVPLCVDDALEERDRRRVGSTPRG